jgi:hypothetical protein
MARDVATTTLAIWCFEYALMSFLLLLSMSLLVCIVRIGSHKLVMVARTNLREEEDMRKFVTLMGELNMTVCA